LLQAYPRRRALKEELSFWLSEKPHGPMTE